MNLNQLCDFDADIDSDRRRKPPFVHNWRNPKGTIVAHAPLEKKAPFIPIKLDLRGVNFNELTWYQQEARVWMESVLDS